MPLAFVHKVNFPWNLHWALFAIACAVDLLLCLYLYAHSFVTEYGCRRWDVMKSKHSKNERVERKMMESILWKETNKKYEKEMMNRNGREWMDSLRA